MEKILAGEQNITAETIFKICKKLDVKPGELFDIFFD
ncbi:MAG: helix-turn-helix domain-containing protein [Leptospirales bacterium]